MAKELDINSCWDKFRTRTTRCINLMELSSPKAILHTELEQLQKLVADLEEYYKA